MTIRKSNRGSSFRFKFYCLVFVSILLFSSCSKDSVEDTVVVETTDINQFSIQKLNNPNLYENIDFNIENSKITGRIPQLTNITDLIASFTHKGANITVDGIDQVSGHSSNDFSNVINYVVKTIEGDEKSYNVDLINFTALPIINITTDNELAIDTKEDYRIGHISLIGNRKFPNFENVKMKIRGRGNSTWGVHPKKPYQLKFDDKTELFGIPEDKKWIFLAEFSDKSLIRNEIAFELGYISNLNWTPKSTFAEVVVNGEHIGLYNISQKVEESDNRVALGDNGYLLEIDQLERLDEDDVYFYSNNFLINIKEPNVEHNSSEYIFVKNLIIDFEQALHGENFKDEVNGYKKYIDIDSFIDWYLISEITKNQDSKSFSSIFLNFVQGEKIKMGPLWDFDLAFGNVNYSDAEHPEGFWVKDHIWYKRLFEDEDFVNKVKNRFIHFRENQNFILERMNYYENHLKWSQEENDKLWNLFGNYVWPNPVVYNSHSEEIAHLKNWFNERMDWLDNAYIKL